MAIAQFDTYKDEAIQGWYCICPTGSRVVGCCVHIASLLWYLNVCRTDYDDKGHSLLAQYLLQTVEDCVQYVENLDADDEEESESRYCLTIDNNDISLD